MQWINHALQLAGLCGLSTAPNPKVGCVLISPDNRLLGSGYTQPAGAAHAEVAAINDAKIAGNALVGATAYVTLEPCSHFGRTPPCCNALVDAGIAKVIVAILDPNPLVSGRGAQMLRDAGIEVEVLPVESAAAVASRELNIGFFSRMVRKTPWVRMKTAASLDGQTALSDGTSQWITGQAARADGHAWRARSCAVLTGIGTVLSDDPLLDVRHVDTLRQPHLVIVDSRLDTPLDARLFSTLGQRATSPEAAAKFNVPEDKTTSIAGRALYIYAAQRNDAKKQALEALGATVIYLPETSVHQVSERLNSPNAIEPSPSSPSAGGQVGAKVDLRAMMLDLGRREINALHVEAGFKLNGSLITAGVVDELLVYTAPKLLGPGMGMANTPALAALTDALQLDFTSATLVGEDLRTVARVRGRDRF